MVFKGKALRAGYVRIFWMLEKTRGNIVAGERRTYARYKIPLSIQIKQENNGRRMFMGTTLNFSRSGMCVIIDGADPELKDAVDLKVKLPGKDVFVPAVGDVIWTEYYENKCVAGIKLVAMNQEAKFYILSYCHGLQS